MHVGTITHNFDRVSGQSNNCTIPLLGQQDEQSETVNADNKAIDSDENDILTEYPPWSSEIHDKYDSAEYICDKNRKDIQIQICNDIPVKTEENKPYDVIIDTYNRDRAQINQSLSDRLGLGQNSLQGAQQVTAVTKHTDQMIDIPEHLEQISLGKEIQNYILMREIEIHEVYCCSSILSQRVFFELDGHSTNPSLIK